MKTPKIPPPKRIELPQSLDPLPPDELPIELLETPESEHIRKMIQHHRKRRAQVDKIMAEMREGLKAGNHWDAKETAYRQLAEISGSSMWQELLAEVRANREEAEALQKIKTEAGEDKSHLVEGFRKYTAEHPKSADGLCALGSALMENGDIPGGKASFSKALEIVGPNMAPGTSVRIRRGRALADAGEIDTAIADFDYALESADVEAQVFLAACGLGDALNNAGRYDEADEAWVLALKYAITDDSEVQFRKWIEERRQSRPGSTTKPLDENVWYGRLVDRDEYSKKRAREREENAETMAALVEMITAAGEDKGRVIRDFREFVQAHPENPSAHLHLGNMLLRYDGDGEECEASFRNALRLAGDRAEITRDAYVGLAVTLIVKGRAEEGIAEFGIALELARMPEQVINPCIRIGLALESAGRSAQADEMYEIALRHCSSDEAAEILRKEIDTKRRR